MASLENRTGYFNAVFRFGGKKYTRSLHTDEEQEAQRLLANLEQTIRDIKSGRITLPPDADIPTFLLSDGNLSNTPVSHIDEVSELRISLRNLFESFFHFTTRQFFGRQHNFSNEDASKQLDSRFGRKYLY